MHKYILILVSLFALVGCQDRYRYPCQDPENHGKPECSKEICNETKECPKVI
jgi:hypothetical protein